MCPVSNEQRRLYFPNRHCPSCHDAHLCFVCVANGVVDPALQEVDLGEHGLVIELLELLQKAVDAWNGLAELPRVVVEGDEPRLEVLREEDAAGRASPLDVLLDRGNLHVRRVRNLGEEVEEGADELGRLGLGDGGHERP